MHERETTETADGQARAWLAEHGWQLVPDDLRAALEERGASVDVIVELLDEAADRKRAATAQQQTQSAQASGNGSRPQTPPAPFPTPAPPAGAIPPQNLEAEESVLGAMMISPIAIGKVRDILGDDGRDFYRDSHAIIYRAALALYDAGGPVDDITLAAELERRGELDRVGGRIRVKEISLLVPASANAPHYAAIVQDTATLRGLIQLGGETAKAGWEREGAPADILARLREQFEGLEQRTITTEETHLVGGGDFILDAPANEQGIWGDDNGQIGWAQGEGLMLVGPQGAGKTTLMQQLALARAGLLTRTLGLAVQTDDRPILYVAADRPRQAARSLARMVADHNRDQLNDRVRVWRGPLPFLLNEQPTALARLCERLGIGTVFLDSVKDVAVRISEDEPAAKFNMAVQHCLANGIEVVCAHHQRKQQPGAPKPKTLADVYGNTWLTAGMGSVVLLWGEPGDPIVELSHLKSPVEEIGPWNVLHDHEHGISRRHQSVSLETILEQTTNGLTAKAAAGLLRQTDNPSANDIEKARRQLSKLARQGRATEQTGDNLNPSRYYPSKGA